VNDPDRSVVHRGMPRPQVRDRAVLQDHGSGATSRDVGLAAELLDVVNESELEHFLRRLVADGARRSGGAVPPDIVRGLVEVLRTTAQRTLPTLSAGAGVSIVSGASPQHSTAETAARVFGLELEGMSAEDRDFEIARQLVRFAQAATARAAGTQLPGSPGAGVAAVVAGAGRDFAPGLLAASSPPGIGAWRRSGSSVELIGVEQPRR
jgi:hypothetical protein